MSERTLNVLFLCSGNCARAIMAEALLNRFGSGRFRAFSAALEPIADIDPLALEVLDQSGFDCSEVRSRRWTEFVGDSAPHLDFVIHLSPEVGTELPDQWPAGTIRANWRITDPGPAHGDIAEHRSALRRAFRELENRVKLFALLRHDTADALHAS